MQQAMLLHQPAVKPDRRVLIAHTCLTTPKLLHVHDRLTSISVDTGAEVSVLHATLRRRSLPPTSHLFAANGSRIPVFQQQTLQLELHLRQSFTWTFYMAAVSRPILCADFLHHFNLLVDISITSSWTPSLHSGPVVELLLMQALYSLSSLKTRSTRPSLEVSRPLRSPTRPTDLSSTT